LKIAFNTRLLLSGKLEGIGWFTFETLKRITQDHPEHEFLFIFDRLYSDEFLFGSNVKAVYAGPPTRHIFLFFPWFEFQIPRLLKKYKADVFVSTDGQLSLLSNVPQIAVIHDLNFHHNPEQLPKLVRWYYNTFFHKYAQKAARIATVSEYTKQDIVKTYRIDASKIDVTLNGCNTRYVPLSEAENDKTRNQYTDGKAYFLFVGLIIPRKNLVRLMRAFELFKTQSGSEMRLLIVGEKKWWDKAHEEAYQSLVHKNDIHFAGRLMAEDLHKVLSAAFALTFIPIFEGFGIPIIEAFSCGTPVITSNVTSMPEVAGGAALLVDPFQEKDIAEKMNMLVESEELQKRLVEKGLERKQAFSWDYTASQLWKCIENVLVRIKA
jgi:glycosyltransferase involved in cell wall biosynthesis